MNTATSSITVRVASACILIQRGSHDKEIIDMSIAAGSRSYKQIQGQTGDTIFLSLPAFLLLIVDMESVPIRVHLCPQ